MYMLLWASTLQRYVTVTRHMIIRKCFEDTVQVPYPGGLCAKHAIFKDMHDSSHSTLYVIHTPIFKTSYQCHPQYLHLSFTSQSQRHTPENSVLLMVPLLYAASVLQVRCVTTAGESIVTGSRDKTIRIWKETDQGYEDDSILVLLLLPQVTFWTCRFCNGSLTYWNSALSLSHNGDSLIGNDARMSNSTMQLEYSWDDNEDSRDDNEDRQDFS